jgi:membrane-associated phospholipid phosphatase
MTDRKAFLMIGAGGLLILAGAACWWFGADLTLHRMLRLRGPAAPHVVFLSALGGFAVMGPVALAAMAFLLWRKRTIDAVWLLLTIGIGRLAVEGIKLVVVRPRPPTGDWLEIVKSWSFPSSHSAGTMMTCVALALLFGRGERALIVALLAALAIGWSRVALGVHWPSDVLAGWGFGLAWLGLSLGLKSVVAPSS